MEDWRVSVCYIYVLRILYQLFSICNYYTTHTCCIAVVKVKLKYKGVALCLVNGQRSTEHYTKLFVAYYVHQRS